MNVEFIDNSPDDLCIFFSELEYLVQNDVVTQYSTNVLNILERHKIINNNNWARISPLWLTNHPYFLTRGGL